MKFFVASMIFLCVFLILLCLYLFFSQRLYVQGYAAVEEGVAILNKKKKVVFFNSAFLRVLGLRKYS
jgi:hypothetical protein